MQPPIIMRKSGYGHDLDLLIILDVIECLTTYEKWVRREKCPSDAHLRYISCLAIWIS